MTTTADRSSAQTANLTATRASLLFLDDLHRVHQRRDRDFAWLMATQWLCAIALALLVSPLAWTGKLHSTHLHVYAAVFLGGALSLPPIALALTLPGEAITRHTAAAAQMLWSALLIHLTGGRIETHFHIFGSLAFIAFYRDPRVIFTATGVVAADHLLRGLFWAESVYGVANADWWRVGEHIFWVLFEDGVLLTAVFQNLREMRALATRQAELEELNASVEHKVRERTRDLEASRERYRALVEATHTVPWQWELDTHRFSYVGPQADALLGCATTVWLAPDFLGGRLHPDDRGRFEEGWRPSRPGEPDRELELRLRREDGSWVWLRAIVGASADQQLRGLLIDVTEQRQLELELRQAQKLESVGRLASGVAHEINTPIQFVSDSVSFIQEAVQALFTLIAQLRGALAASGPSPATVATIARQVEEADLSYLCDELPQAVDRSCEGLTRVATIVRAMKEFAHPERSEMSATDLNHAILSTLTIASHEYKYVADVVTELEQDLPPVTCSPGEINQAILNIVINAAHAIGDSVAGSGRRGRIVVRTQREGDRVAIAISDDGGGIAEHVRGHIFDPFFTTKEVGKGTGQGLAIARSVVRDKHGGELTFESEVGRGTTFFIRLPIDATNQRKSQVAA